MTQAAPSGEFGARKPRKPVAGIAALVAGLAIVVMGCGGLVVALGLPALAKARETARLAVAQSNMRKINVALGSYAALNRGEFPPPGSDWRGLLVAHGIPVNSPCYYSTTPGRQSMLSVFYVPPGPVAGITNPAATVVLYEAPGNRVNGGIIGYADGAAVLVPEPQYSQIIAGLKLPDGTPWAPHRNGEQ